MTHFKILTKSRKKLERDEFATKIDKLDKYDKCIKKLRRKFPENRAIKKSKHFFDSGFLFCKPSKTFKKFRWPVEIVKLRE